MFDIYIYLTGQTILSISIELIDIDGALFIDIDGRYRYLHDLVYRYRWRVSISHVRYRWELSISLILGVIDIDEGYRYLHVLHGAISMGVIDIDRISGP